MRNIIEEKLSWLETLWVNNIKIAAWNLSLVIILSDEKENLLGLVLKTENPKWLKREEMPLVMLLEDYITSDLNLLSL